MSTTDETRERSVAEILGWEYRDVDGYDEFGAWWATVPFDATGQRLVRPHGPTPDDMLAWLRRDGYMALRVDVGVGRDYDGVSVEFLVPPDHYGPTRAEEFTGPTLYAALEAAVRAVAEASDE